MRCAICQMEIQPSANGRRRFCSARCRKENFARIVPLNVRYRTTVKCVICAAEFETSKRPRTRETCSMNCRIALWKDTCQLMREVGLSK